MFLVIVFFNSVNDSSVVGMIFRIFLYLRTTIGFVWFRFIYENKTVKDQLVPLICLVSPALTFLLSENSKVLFFGYVFDNELIIING
jgi:hypothetical protein